MIAHIVCGSPHLWLPPVWDGDIIGVYRGALTLLEKNIGFAVAIGDFDSVSVKERRLIEERVELVIELTSDKDVTDCEAAVEYAVGAGYERIYLYGATGGRFDHQFATIGLLLKYTKRGVEIYVVDEKNKILVLRSGVHWIKLDCCKRYVSFFALEETAKNLTLRNVKYPLAGYDLAVDDSLCVSNEALAANMSVSFDSGYLLVVQSSD